MTKWFIDDASEYDILNNGGGLIVSSTCTKYIECFNKEIIFLSSGQSISLYREPWRSVGKKVQNTYIDGKYKNSFRRVRHVKNTIYNIFDDE